MNESDAYNVNDVEDNIVELLESNNIKYMKSIENIKIVRNSVEIIQFYIRKTRFYKDSHILIEFLKDVFENDKPTSVIYKVEKLTESNKNKPESIKVYIKMVWR